MRQPNPLTDVPLVNWNCGGMSIRDADDWENEVLAHLGNSVIIALQEAANLFEAVSEDVVCSQREAQRRKTARKAVAPVLQGHALVGRRGNQAVFLLPIELIDNVIWRSDLDDEFKHVESTTSLVCGTSGVITCYFPHAGKPDSSFLLVCQKFRACTHT